MTQREAKMNLEKRYFTYEEAEQMLPKVERMILELQAIDKALDLLETVELEIDEESEEQVRYVMKFNKEFHKLSYRYYLLLEKLDGMGIVVKDLEEGLVDFYHTYRGRDVFLCWKLGEKQLGYWHEVNRGYHGRQKIIDLSGKIVSFK